MQLRLVIEPLDDADEDERAELSDQLRRELQELDDVEVTRAAAGPAPPGAKGVDAAALGEVVMTMASGSLVPALGLVWTWAKQRKPRCTVRIAGPDGSTIEIPEVTLEEGKRLIEEWARADPK